MCILRGQVGVCEEGVQVSDYSMCVDRRWCGGGTALCAAVHSLYRSSTRGPEDDSVESKHVAPISHYMFSITIVVFDGQSPPFI